MLDRNLSAPIYVQLANEIRNQINQKKILPGDKLMSESEMVKAYGVARLTVREALNILVNDGLLEKRHGKGTFCRLTSVKKRIHVLLDVTDYYFVPYYTESICSVLTANNSEFIACDTRNSNDEICRYLEEISVRGSDGVIIQGCPSAPVDTDRLKKAFSLLTESNIPFILIDYNYGFTDNSYLILDEIRSGKIAGEYFRKNNHKHIAVACVENNSISKMRLDGFSDVISPDYIFYDNDNLRISLQKAIKKGITGIFCYNDFLAKKILDILDGMHLSVPGDISVITVDNTLISEIYNLTSVTHPKGKIGKEAANALINNKLPTRKMHEPELFIRSSVKSLQ